MIKLFGLYAMNELPVCQFLMQTDNQTHVNLIELARTEFHKHLNYRAFDAVMVVVGIDEAHVFTFK